MAAEIPRLRNDENSYNFLDILHTQRTLYPTDGKGGFFMEELLAASQELKEEHVLRYPEIKFTRVIYSGSEYSKGRVTIFVYRQETVVEYATRMEEVKRRERYHKMCKERAQKAAATRAKRKQEKEYETFIKLKEKFEK